MILHKNFFKNNWDMMASIGVTLIAFFYLFGFAVLDLHNIALVTKGGDFTVSYLGSVFYRMDEWRWPIFTHMNLAYPYGISVHGTDGSPLLSVIFKAFHTFFGMDADVQFVGWWTLICYVLQAVVSVLIFRHAFQNKFCVFIGSLFFVSAPIMMMRVFVHINLMPHFILLFAILMCLRNKLGLAEWIWMGVLMTLGILTCPYFLPMISGFFAVLMIQKGWVEKTVSWVSLIKGIAFLTAVFFFWWYMLGMASTEQNLASGGWRTLGLNLTALFNPIWSKSQVFNTLTPKADFDADDYFGFGLLVLLVALFADVKDLFRRDNLKKHAALALLLVGFVLFALTPQIKAGTVIILDYKPGDTINWLGSVFRYSGRFFWPVWYLLAYFLIKTVVQKFPKKAVFILPALLFVQIWDLSPTFQAKSSFSLSSYPQPEKLVSKEWDRLDKKYDNIFIFAHNNGYRDMWRWALKHGKNVNYGFLNRPSRKVTNLVNAVREEILSGYVSSADYFYVIDSDLKKRIDEAAKVNPAVAELKKRIQKIDTYEILEYQTDLHQNYLTAQEAAKGNKIPVTHRYWRDDLIQTGPYRLYRPLEKNDRDYATMVRYDDKMLILKWDRYGTEEFEKKSDGRYHQIVKEEKEGNK